MTLLEKTGLVLIFLGFYFRNILFHHKESTFWEMFATFIFFTGITLFLI